MINPRNLFIATFIVVISTYLFVFGQEKTIEIIKAEYLSIIALGIISIALIYLKLKLKDYELINFVPNNSFSLKSTIAFFLVFQGIDYYYEDGFLGMISQWFLYWVMGLIALSLIHTINYYKNYKLIYKHIKKQG